MNLGIIFKCEEASHICDKSQYEESSFWEHLLMKMHHMMCKVCREHSAINTKLSRLIRRADVKTLPDDARNKMKEKIQKEISK